MAVPKLRFKADDGSEFPEWEEMEIGEITGPISSGNSKNEIGSATLYGSMGVIGTCKEATYVGCKILVARVGANAGTLQYVVEDCGVSDNTLVIKETGKVDFLWLFYCLTVINIGRMRFGGGQPLVTGKMIEKKKISIPSLPEQRKIASFLSTIDEIIQSTESELTAWQERKKGVMQKIFNREVRFKADDGSEFPEWEEKRLGDLFKISAGGDIDKENCSKSFSLKYPYPVYANALVNRGLYGYANYYKVQGDTFTVTGRGDVGCAVARHGKYVPIVRLLVCEPKENDNVDFFAEHVNGATIFVESTGVPQLTAPQLGKVKVKRPSLPEQKKIADCLSSLDDVISNIQAELSAWKEFKKGLLQQMFV